MDLGYDQQNFGGGGGYSGSKAGGYGNQNSGYGKYDNNNNDFQSKDSTNYTNSNYRKPFNPNNMQTPVNHGG